MVKEDAFSYSNPATQASAQEGLLAGSRLALQSNLCVRGWPTRACSRALENFVALEDATAVERLLAAGAHIAGYTQMAELGFGLAGDTTAGTVASSSCDAAIMTDTMGEARLAAAEAGLIGFKPTAGIVSRYGLVGLVPSMESLGVAARDISLIQKVLQAISGPDDRDFSMGSEFPDFSGTAAGAGLRSAVVIPQSLAGLDSTEKQAFESALAVQREKGVEIREAQVEQYELFRVIHQAIGSAEASSSTGKYDSVRYGYRAAKADDWNEMYLKSREESFGSLVKAFLFQGAYFQFRDYPAFENACRIRRGLVAALDDVLQDSDVVILPTRKKAVPNQPAAVSEVYDQFALTLAANVAGLPAISLPGFVKADNDDLGLQLVARRLEDDKLLGYAAQL